MSIIDEYYEIKYEKCGFENILIILKKLKI
jgi:hypothetical protein